MHVRRPALAALCLSLGCGEESAGAGAIEILVDDMGVAHVFAATDEDAWYGAGYRMAEDRLYQMEMLRRFALGRLSEVIGEAGLERDRQARMVNVARWGRADCDATREEDPERAAIVDAWIAGVNRRIEEVRAADERPFGYGPDEHDFSPEPWEACDPYVVLKGAGVALDRTVEFDIAVTLLSTVYPDAMAAVDLLLPAHEAFVLPPKDRPAGGGSARRAPECEPAEAIALHAWRAPAWPRRHGSNSFAIDGRHTETGTPLIAGDPHLSFDFFGAPYPLHVSSADAGGTYDVAGFAYPGTPGIALGHNRRVAWTATSAFADVTDAWAVERNGDGVVLGGDTVPVTPREEIVVVRDEGAPAGEGREETLLYEDVEGYGVIIPDDLLPLPIGGPYLFGWTGFTGRPARWFMELNRIADLSEFEEAVDRMREMTYNLLAADATGIAYRVGVDVPVRDVTETRAPWKVLDGGDAGSLWTGEMLPRAKLPRSRAGERGWIATANNDPFGFTANGRVDDDPWYYGGLFDPGYRAHRLESEVARLVADGGVTIAHVQALQTDLASTLADDLLPLLADARANADSDDALAEFRGDADLDAVVALLAKDWDRRMARDSAGALAFQAFLHSVGRRSIGDDIALGYDFAIELQTLVVLKVAAMLVAGEYAMGEPFLQGGRDFVLLSAAREVAEWLAAEFGGVDASDPDFRYDDRKRTSFDHAYGYGVPLVSLFAPTDGGEDTVNVSQNISYSATDPWVTRWVPVERTTATFSDDGTPEAWVNFPLGAAADPDSEATAAANADWVEGRYRRLLFSRDEIEAAAVQRLELRRE